MYIWQVKVTLGVEKPGERTQLGEGVASVKLSPWETLGCGTVGSRAALPRGDGTDPRPA